MLLVNLDEGQPTPLLGLRHEPVHLSPGIGLGGDGQLLHRFHLLPGLLVSGLHPVLGVLGQVDEAPLVEQLLLEALLRVDCLPLLLPAAVLRRLEVRPELVLPRLGPGQLSLDLVELVPDVLQVGLRLGHVLAVLLPQLGQGVVPGGQFVAEPIGMGGNGPQLGLDPLQFQPEGDDRRSR